VAAEAAAFMSTLSALINWGSSFIINDFYKPLRPRSSPRSQVLVSRLTTLFLFLLAAFVAVFYVRGMVSWFLFINSVMVIFILPLSWLRFFWWRFNVCGELSATVLGLPLSILVWFVLGFQHKPFWQSTGFLFLLSILLLTAVSLLTPPEPEKTLVRFYKRCRPPGFWRKVRMKADPPLPGGPSLGYLGLNCLLGIASCLGLVVLTNSLFAGDWLRSILGASGFALFGCGLIRRVLMPKAGRGE
jgi:SSS family solute:Na+ symporter